MLEKMLRRVPFFLVCCFFAVSAQASFSPRHYQLECGQYFGCPQALHRRIHFWIDIFGRYNTNTAVFHDRDQPEKVYSVLERPGACGGRSTPRAIERERSRIKQLLLSIADKKQKKKSLTSGEKKLARLFTQESPTGIRKASKRIRCQSGNSTRFRKAFKRFGAHRHAVSTALKEFGLPEGIQYLPFVESAYHPGNYSRVGAAGLWQLMPRTASHLGLLVNPVIDERMDPEISTLGAIRYLQHSYEVLAPAAHNIKPTVTEAEIYPFVMTSYNFGLSGMLRAMKTVGVDFVEVLERYQSRSFQVAVKNFYASFLAARHVAMHADQFFSHLPENKPVKTISVTNNKARSAQVIARHFGLTVEQLSMHNPALTSAVWKGVHLIPKGFVLRIPQSTKRNLSKQIAQLNKLPANKPPKKLQHYRVRKGDSACRIAHRFKVSCKQLVHQNKLGRKAIVKIGSRLTIPGGSVVLSQPVTAARGRIFGQRTLVSEKAITKPVATVRRLITKNRIDKDNGVCGTSSQNQLNCRQLKLVGKTSNTEKITNQRALTGQDVSTATVKLTEAVSVSGISATKVTRHDSVERNQMLAELHDVSYLDRFVNDFKFTRQSEKTSNQSLAQHTPDKQAIIAAAAMTSNEAAQTFTASHKISTTQLALLKSRSIKEQSTDKKIVTPVAKIKDRPQKKVNVHAVARAQQPKTADTHLAQKSDLTKDLRATFKKDKGWTIRVATDETLGHYADWLGIGFSKPILKLNGIKYSRSVRLGKIIRLPIKDKAAKRRFEKKRIAFHRNLQNKYLAKYAVTGKKQYRFQSGDNPWTIATVHQIPLWLLKRYNPDIFDSRHDIGNIVVLPVLEPQQSLSRKISS